MPIVDLELVVDPKRGPGDVSAQQVADALGEVFGSAPGRTWVRIRSLDAACYAENGGSPGDGGPPAFVTVLHAHPPEGADRAREAWAVTHAVARVIGRPPGRVHVQYAQAAAGRQAFGGQLVE